MIDPAVIQSQIHQVQATLPHSVRLIAVTKYVTTAEMRVAYECGLRDFAESRIQDAQQKIAEFQDCSDVSWHFIGHLQSNKAKSALQLFDWIHSVDSLKLAQRLEQIASHLGQEPQVLLQVKMRPDPQKKGWSPESLISEIYDLEALKFLKFRGLMTILPQGLNNTEKLETFLATRKLFEQIKSDGPKSFCFDQVSMGMSQDYQWATQAGATMVRLGSILFPRSSTESSHSRTH